jgi:GNAT superfamily N-acetyltransferase
METTIRLASASDADACSRVLCASIRELCFADHRGDSAHITNWTSNKSTKAIADWISTGTYVLFVAERDGHVIAVGAVEGGSNVASLNYVAPEARFAGVSRAMLAHLESYLRQRGFLTARLVSTETAHRFYASNGWRDAGDPVTAFGGAAYPMEKDL